MLTKGAIGNLVNRYRAVLKKCNLINTFGSLAVASMLVLGGAGVAGAVTYNDSYEITGENISIIEESDDGIAFKYDKTKTSDFLLAIGDDDTKTIKLATNSASNMAGVFVNYVSGLTTGGTHTVNMTAKDSIGIYANNATAGGALWVQGQVKNKTTVNISAPNVTIEGNTYAVMATGGAKINIDGNSNGTIKLKGNAGAIVARGESVIDINKSGKHAVMIDGNIVFNKVYNTPKTDALNGADADIILNLTTSDSYFKGAIVVTNGPNVEDENIEAPADVDGMAIALSNGAAWTATGDSFVNNLNLNGGNVNILAGADISADDVIGNGGNVNFEDAEELGTFTVENATDTNLNVQAIDETGAVKNADQVDATTLKKMQAQVKDANGKALATTATAAEGDVNGAITIAKDGTPTIARNTLMDAALQQASITTVSLDRILTNDVRKRLGDIRSDANTTGVWMRWDGGKLKGDGGLTNNFNTIQIGGDTKVAKNCRLGVAGSFTHGDTDFARGNGELEGFSFAAYATWMGENGMFADVVARLGHFSTEMNVEGRTGDMDNRVASISGEYGWRFNLCDQFFVEPQVELAYTYVNSEDLQLGDAKYSFDSVDSLTGRAGLVAGWNLPDDRGNVYARASVVQQFMGDAKISGSNGSAHNVQEIDGDDTWLEYGIGANVKLTDNTYIWADVERTEGAEIGEEWRGTVGFRYSF